MPNYIAPSVHQVDYDRLFAAGVRHLVFDVDNTLVSFGAPELDQRTVDLLRRLKDRPEVESLRLATNSPRDLSHIAGAVGVPVVQPGLFSFKPLPRFYRRIVRQTGSASPAAVAMIGDKLIQDVWGANHVGLTTVLVRPLGRDNWLDRLLHVRVHERLLLRRYLPHHHERWF